MKDSQDWLDEILDKLKLFTKTPLGRMTPEQDEATLDWRQAKSAIREHFLKEALELIGKDKEKPDILHDAKLTDRLYRHEALESYGRLSIENQLRQELRNKFNDKYKED